MIQLPLRFTLFPYTTLFRSRGLLTGDGSDDSTRQWREGTKSGVSRAHHAAWQPARADSQARRSHQQRDRKSTRLNSSHLGISYAVFCLKKKKAESRKKLNIT